MKKEIDLDQLRKAEQEARRKANDEYNQNSYNAAWLHGYAAALGDILDIMERQTE